MKAIAKHNCQVIITEDPKLPFIYSIKEVKKGDILEYSIFKDKRYIIPKVIKHLGIRSIIFNYKEKYLITYAIDFKYIK